MRWFVFVVVAFYGGLPARGGTVVERLGSGDRFRHCTIEGESRPASVCARPVLLATHKGRRIPPSGLLRISLPPHGELVGPLVVQTEAYVYEHPPPSRFAHTVLRGVDKILSSAQHFAALAAMLESIPGLERVPTVPTSGLAVVPPATELRVPADLAGRRVVYAVWAWPAGIANVDVPIPSISRDPRVTLAAGVQDVALAGLGPVRFEADVLDAATGGTVAVLWRLTLDPAKDPSGRGWHEHTVDLTPWAGGAYRIALRAGDGDAGFGTWARPMLRATDDGDDERPNLLLLSVDTLRADHVGTYGQERPTTPRLDRLAATSVVFTRAYAPFPSTTASHMSMLTAIPPCAHGVTVPNGQLGASIPTLAEILAAHGYATIGLTEDGLIKGEAGFDRGFDRYRDLRPNEELGSFHTGIELAEQWLDARVPGPFFMFLHTYQVHVPYKKPPHLQGLFTAPEGAPEWARQMADYDVGLRYADELFGGLLDFLEARGLLDRLVLVVTSDHGTEFGERGGIGHARGVHTEQLHVPLIVHVSPLVARVSDIVGVIDVTPTLLDLAGVSALPTFTGRSLVPLLHGAPLAPREAIGEQLWGPRETALRDGAHTWIETSAGTALYDVRDDPGERRDLAREWPELTAQGHERILEFRRRCTADSARLNAPVTIDPDRTRALKALGYLR